MTHRICAPLSAEAVSAMHIGDRVLISGAIYTARDAAHKRLVALINTGAALPVDLSGQILYYAGPTPPPPGRPIGSAGPTTSSRMDAYAPLVLDKTGLRVMIGKGNRSAAVIDAMKRNGCAYLAAVGGAGALLAAHVTASTIVCYEDLGAEAVYRLTVQDFPAVVAIDCAGNSLFVDGAAQWRR